MSRADTIIEGFKKGKEGIETVFDNASKYVNSSINSYMKSRRIGQIAKERGYRRTSNGDFLPEELFTTKQTPRGKKYVLKPFQYWNGFF